MPLQKAPLDTRTFDQLVGEGISRLPRLAPQWTDYNASNSGIALLELLAWRTEQTSYRLDRTPPVLARAFMRLLGVEPSRPQVADTVLLISATNAPFVLPAGIQVGSGVSQPLFQTTEDLTVSAAQLTRVLAGNVDVTSANATGGQPFAAFGDAPQPSSALYLGFDQALGAPGTMVRIHLWTPDPAGDRLVTQRLIAEYNAAVSDEKTLCSPSSGSGVMDWRLHYSVRTVWEYYRGAGSWAPLPDLVDATRALSLSGTVTFSVPADHVPGGADPLRFYVRCRIVRGSYECLPRIDRIAHNAVLARHAVDVAAPEALGSSAGHAYERFPLSNQPVVPGRTALTVTLASGPDPGWTEVSSWDESGPHDRHYLLDSASGVVTGGNGALAKVIPSDASLSITYQVGGGAGGDVAARTLNGVSSSSLNTTRYQAANGGAAPDWSQISLLQPYDALGGADPEEWRSEEARANDVAFAASRAITLDDFSRLSLCVPGVPAARARALVDHHPDVPCFVAPGSITVVVLPGCPDYQPVPSTDFLAAIQRFLDRRRTVATEVHVVAPCFTSVTVTATLNLRAGVDAGSTLTGARTALENFFHPLRGGPDGNGWPIGRSVYRSEVMSLLAGLPGVIAVTQLGLAGGDAVQPQCGDLTLCPDYLVRSGTHRLTAAGAPALKIINRSEPDECA